jgi:hypothetical protein
MSKESLKRTLEALGTFPTKGVVQKNFEWLLKLAEEQSETVHDLAWGFSLALDQMSQVGSLTDTRIIQRLQDWTISNWALEPDELRETLCLILVNVPSPKVLSFLIAKRDQLVDQDIIDSINLTIDEISLDKN